MASVVNELFSHLVKKKNKIKKGHPRVLWNIFFFEIASRCMSVSTLVTEKLEKRGA